MQAEQPKDTTSMTPSNPLESGAPSAPPMAMLPPLPTALSGAKEDDLLDIKTFFNGDVRRFSLAPTASFEELVEKIMSIYGLAQQPHLQWEDEDGDHIELRGPDDWKYLKDADDDIIRIRVRGTQAPGVPSTLSSPMDAAKALFETCKSKVPPLVEACKSRIPPRVVETLRPIAPFVAMAMVPGAVCCAVHAVGHLLRAAVPLAIVGGTVAMIRRHHAGHPCRHGAYSPCAAPPSSAQSTTEGVGAATSAPAAPTTCCCGDSGSQASAPATGASVYYPACECRRCRRGRFDECRHRGAAMPPGAYPTHPSPYGGFGSMWSAFMNRRGGW